MNLREWQESFLTRSNNRLVLNMTKRVSKREKLHILLFNSYFIANFATMKMIAVCFVGTFITEFISNTAAGAMFFPIMYEAAEKLGYDPFPFLVALMVSVSSSFATPIGSPTHMLVYGPGGYRFSDFMRIGLLMNIIILAANILIVNIVYPLTPLP